MVSELRCRHERRAMIFLIGFLIAMGIWETYVTLMHHYPEDILLTVMCFGAAAFLLAAKLNEVTLLP